MYNAVKHFFIRFFTVLIVLIFTGCSEQTAPFENSPDVKRIRTTDTKQLLVEPTQSKFQYPQASETIVYYIKKQKAYDGAALKLPNGSTFVIEYQTLIPPSHLYGNDITVTMQVEKNELNNELIYSFGPSGCQFDPPAELWLRWADLGSDYATLYYLDDAGNRIEHLPDNIDQYDRKMNIRIDHFSRYAMAYSD